MTNTRQMFLALGFAIAFALPGSAMMNAANAEGVGVGIHVGNVGVHVGAHANRHRYHRYHRHYRHCVRWGWHHHQRVCRRWN